jgi:hypothetical protein
MANQAAVLYAPHDLRIGEPAGSWQYQGDGSAIAQVTRGHGC